MATSQDFVNWVCGERLDWRFLMYVLLAERESYSRFAHGTTHQTIYFPEVKAFHVCLPSLAEQRRIAGVLGALDDKIEHNSAMSSRLLAMSDAVVVVARSHGQRLVSFGDLVTFFNSQRVPLSALQRAGMQGTYPYYGATGVFDHVGDYLFDGVYLLAGEYGSVITEDKRPVTQYVWGRFWVNNHAHTMQGSRVSTELASVVLRSARIDAAITGAVQPKLSMKNLKAVEVALPLDEELGSVEDSLRPLFALYRSLRDEGERLREFRDLLLPKLVTGQIRVPESYDPDDVLGTVAKTAAGMV